MTKTLTSILVGSHFVPPAKILLEHLPAGTPLGLRPVEDNPYDEHAVEVWLTSPREAFPESQLVELEVKLPGTGHDLEEVLASEKGWRLGHLAASDGKPLAKASVQRAGLVGNREFRDACPAGDLARREARLEFDGSGLMLVVMEVEE